MMSKSTFIMVFTLVAALISCTPHDEQLSNALNRSGENKAELEKALEHYSGEKQEAMQFLIRYMPERDLNSLSAAFLIENLEYAYKAKDEFPWAGKLDKEVFFNEVLPYASLNETRERWRPDFYARFKKYVSGAQSIEEAIWAINNNILKEVDVEYNTKRKKPDQSPFESMEIKMASCSGLSILLVDAFRAVGIPARVAGTPNWYNNSGNHNWVEVYVDGRWHFTEYYPSGHFDESWFLERAGKANSKDAEQWIYAASYKPTDCTFPLVWDRDINYVYAHNVTDRYISLYSAQNQNRTDAIALQVVMLKNKQCSISGNNRVKKQVDLISNDEVLDSGFTSGSEDDMNNYLTFKVGKDLSYQLRYTNAKGETITREVEPLKEDNQIILTD